MNKILRVFISSLLILTSYVSNAQGINFQGVARSANGTILASSNISLRLSILSKSVDATAEYVETKKVVTNAQGIFSIVIGDGVTATVGTFKNVNWAEAPKFLKVEMDPSGGTSYISMGITQLQYVPYAFYSLGVAADNVTGVLSVEKGGTGVGSLADLKTALKITTIDTTSLSNRIDSKLTKGDTASLSKRIDSKMSSNNSVFPNDITVNGNQIGLGSGSIPSNIVIGNNSLKNNTIGYSNTIVGSNSFTLNTSGFRNSVIGDSAMMVSTTGEGNTAIGHNSLRSNTTGFWNTGIGIGALLTNTTGDNNTAVGRSSMLFNTTGIWNAALGSNSLNANTTGWYNTAIGSNAMLKSTTGSMNTALGNSALEANITGSNNVAIGYHSLFSSTDVSNLTALGYSSLSNNTTGASNSSIGAYALFSNTTGSNNYSFGQSALYSNQTSNANIAIGSVTLKYHTSGDGNVAIGHNALYTDVSGTNNIALGYNSLYSNTSGQENTAIGTYALTSNTSANSNVAIGKDAMYANTIGVRNTALGVVAMRYNVNASWNTALGYAALYLNQSGSGNTAMGNESNYSNVSGNQNVAVGSMAMRANITGSNNTALGYSAMSSSSTYSNSSAIGYNAQVTSSNQIQLGDVNVTEVKTSGMVISGKGFLPPKLFASERDAIVSPATALIIFCKNCGIKGQMQYYDGSAWVDMTGNTAASALEVGTSFQGGVIGYFLQQGDPGYDPNILHGFIAANADLSSATWCNGAYSSTGAVSTIIGAGYSNTTTIVNVQGVGSYAAKLCKDYRGGSYSDWYLPSEDELYKIWLNRVAIGGLGDLSTTSRPYWSSTDYAPVPPAVVSAGARYIEFGNGARNGGDKFSIFRVRPIRSF